MAHGCIAAKLASLPVEIRSLVWEFFSMKPSFAFVLGDFCPDKDERMFLLEYDKMILQFHISPTYQHKSWCSVESSIIGGNSRLKRKGGAEWPLQDLDDAMRRGFHKLHYQKMKRVQIDVGAPDHNDPGQVFCLYKKCLDLATMLEHAENDLLNLEINLLDSEQARWTWNRQLQSSIIQHPIEVYELVLSAFSRLRNVKSAKFRIPVQLDPSNHLIENMEAKLELEGPFGSNVAPDGDEEWDDRDIQTEKDLLFMKVDLELDFLHGHTANMMRLDRFSFWYTDKIGGESKYESEYERIIRSWKHLPEPPDRLVQLTVLERLQWRHRAMMIFDPRARFRPSAQERHPSVQLTSNAEDVTSIWNPDDWYSTYHYGDWWGIPSFDSVCVFFYILLPRNAEACRQYHVPFWEKLRKWLSDDN
ncbi:MAG: hypothetical protein Q9207_001531 [Kuettlingeria erythrocarpa]